MVWFWDHFFTFFFTFLLSNISENGLKKGQLKPILGGFEPFSEIKNGKKKLVWKVCHLLLSTDICNHKLTLHMSLLKGQWIMHLF